MEDFERARLEDIVLAPYVQKATALIGLARRVGGNQFRHAMATFAILVDYHYTDPVLLKAAVIHDLFEDFREARPAEIEAIDEDGPAVLQLAMEVSRRGESRSQYLSRLRDDGSRRAKILKVADRISNLTDLNGDVFSATDVAGQLDETERYVLPMADDVNPDMAREIRDLILRKRDSLLQPPSSESTVDPPAPA
jgi:(p)ppGpp synthase/HD superfamily hydrolase